MKYIFYNILEIIRKERIIFFVMCICILSSTFVINFSYGLFYNYTIEKYSSNSDLSTISAEINKDNAPTHKQVKEFVESLSEDTLKNLRFYFSGNLDEYGSQSWKYIESRFTYRNGEYSLDSEIEKTYKENIATGRNISSDDEKNARNVVVMGYNQNNDVNEITNSLGDGETYIKLWGINYNIIGEQKNTYGPLIPFSAVSDDFIYDDVVILSTNLVFTKSQYNDIVNNAEIYMPGAINFPDLALPDTDAITLYNNIIVIAVLLSVLSVLNFAVLFSFILKKNNRNIAILRLCGCSKIKVVMIHMGECFAISIPVYWIGILGCILIFNRFIYKLFDYIKDAYDPIVYLFIFITYFAILLVIMAVVITKQINKNIVNEWKEGKI